MAKKGPKEWSPRPDPVEEFREIASDLIASLKISGDSQSLAISDVLSSAGEDGQLDEALTISILDVFIESAQWAKDEIERLKKSQRK